MIDFGFVTSQGEREYNEDCIDKKSVNSQHFFVLADGLGAHGLGNIASQGACDISVQNAFTKPIEAIVEEIQDVLLREQDKNGLANKMKTTITMIEINNSSYKQLHLGDSRIYHFNKRKIISQTEDHSVCQKLLKAGLIKKSEFRHHKDRNKLLEVLGTKWTEPEPYVVKEGKFKKYEAVLLCTDGFWEWIEEKEMVKCLKKSKTAQEWIDLMEEIVLHNGTGNHMDNYSAIGVLYKE